MGKSSRRNRSSRSSGPTRAPGTAVAASSATSDLERLAENRAAEDRIESRYKPLVRRARIAGASWFEIGLALGVTPQAAHKRFREVDPKRVD